MPSDIVLLESGDKIPAYIRLIKVKEFRVDVAMRIGGYLLL